MENYSQNIFFLYLSRSLFGIKAVLKWWSGKTIISTSVVKVDVVPQPTISVELFYKGEGGFNPINVNCTYDMEDFEQCIGRTHH